MIKDNQKVLNRIYVVMDGCVVALSYMLAWFLKFRSGLMDGIEVYGPDYYMAALYFIVPGYLLLYYFMNLYGSKRFATRPREIYDVVMANIIGLAGFIVAIYSFKQKDFSRSVMFLFFFINVTAEVTMRGVIRRILRNLRKKGFNLKHALLVGYSRAAEQYIDRIRENPQWGYVIVGILDDHIPAGTMYHGVKVLGRIGNLDVILPENKLDEIGISLALTDYDKLEELVRKCEKSGVHTKFIPDYNSVIPTKPYIEDLMGLSVVNIRHVPLTNNLYSLIKRTADIFFSLILIVLFSPVMLISAILIKLSDGGKVIFTQERVGLHQKMFRMYKFRSMREQKEEDENIDWTRKGDPRVTGIGRFLRKTSLDELPQLFNVLGGSMSLVGPRPEQPQYVEKFKEEIPGYMIKHQVRPGITGWAQINGFRGDTSIRKRIECDLYYIENWTMMFDIKIMFLTLFKGFINKNAY
ncbi:MAG: undecaprenyl-phosphate glucose phosphotransferase [Lachnospiraceae bacterium]|nr:undecaprenyl-phosphate glucose phosphotransferase [Lachnospiraceae bacterium]